MASKSTSSDSSSTDAKLVWNSPLDSEETFEVKMAELKTTLIKESIFLLAVHEAQVNVHPLLSLRYTFAEYCA